MTTRNETNRAARAVVIALLAALALLALASTGLATPQAPRHRLAGPSLPQDAREASGNEKQRAMQAFDLSPAVFVENRGQWDESIRYGFDGKGTRVSFTDSGPVFQMIRSTGGGGKTAQTVFSASFIGARTVRPSGLDKSPSTTNYFLGNDPSKWRSGVPSYERIVYRSIYDGVDLYTWGRRSGLKYEFHVAPHADWRQIVVHYDGVDGLSIDGEGALHVKTALGEMVDDAPVVYQETPAGRETIGARFRLVDDSSYGFDLTGDIDASLPLVIDPDLAWASYLGGMDLDAGFGMAIDSTGDVWIAGWTWSSDFPTPGGFQTTFVGNPADVWECHYGDAFIARITPSGTLAWATYLGGNNGDQANAIAIDSTGNIWVAGTTQSSDFPVPGGFQTTYVGGPGEAHQTPGDAFVARITPSGMLAWASYLGGEVGDSATEIAVDSTGNVWVTGETQSWDFPTPGGFALPRGWDFVNDNYEGFVARITPSGALDWATCLGGIAFAGVGGVVVDSTGDAWITGVTPSRDLPAQEAEQTPGSAPSAGAFLARITPWGTLAWVTYFGGSGWAAGQHIALDSTGNMWVTGTTTSTDFPTPGGFQIVSTNGRNSTNIFIARFTPQGSLAWGGCLGGGEYESSEGVAADATGNAWIAGFTQSTDFPTFWGFRTNDNNRRADGSYRAKGFLVQITPSGALAWATCVGGRFWESCDAVAVDFTGGVWLTGYTTSPDFPVPGGFQTALRSDDDTTAEDAFVARISSAPCLTITTSTLPDGAQNTAYRQTLCCSGGAAPYTGSVIGGVMPAGLSLDASTGIISGTPSAPGTSSFTVQVTDSQAPAGTANRALSIVVTPPDPSYHFAASDAETSTTSTGYVGKVLLGFTPAAADDWIIFGFCELKSPNVNYSAFVQLFIDGAGEGQITRRPVDPADYVPFVAVKVKNLTAMPHTVKLMYKTSSSAAAAYVRRARICAVRKRSLELWCVAQNSGVPLTSVLADIVTLNWTPSTTGSYLVISTAEVNAATTVSTDVQTFYNGVLNDEGIIRAADNGDFTTFMSLHYLANAPGGVPIVHKISAKKMAADPVNHYIRRARILALRITGGRFRYAAIASANEQTTTQTAWQQALTATCPLQVNGNWLFLNGARMSNSSTTCQTELRTQFNDNASYICGQQLMKLKNVWDLLNYSSIDVRSLTTPRKVDMDFRTTNTTGTAKVKRLRFYGLPLDGQ